MVVGGHEWAWAPTRGDPPAPPPPPRARWRAGVRAAAHKGRGGRRGSPRTGRFAPTSGRRRAAGTRRRTAPACNSERRVGRGKEEEFSPPRPAQSHPAATPLPTPPPRLLLPRLPVRGHRRALPFGEHGPRRGGRGAAVAAAATTTTTGSRCARRGRSARGCQSAGRRRAPIAPRPPPLAAPAAPLAAHPNVAAPGTAPPPPTGAPSRQSPPRKGRADPRHASLRRRRAASRGGEGGREGERRRAVLASPRPGPQAARLAERGAAPWPFKAQGRGAQRSLIGRRRGDLGRGDLKPPAGHEGGGSVSVRPGGRCLWPRRWAGPAGDRTGARSPPPPVQPRQVPPGAAHPNSAVRAVMSGPGALRAAWGRSPYPACQLQCLWSRGEACGGASAACCASLPLQTRGEATPVGLGAALAWLRGSQP